MGNLNKIPKTGTFGAAIDAINANFELVIEAIAHWYSAYQVWRQQGHEGTEEDFLRSLTAYGIAVEHGYVGTEEQWLASLKGAAGLNGVVLDPDAVTIFDSIDALKGKTQSEKEAMIPDGIMTENLSKDASESLHNALWEATEATSTVDITANFTFTDNKGVKSDTGQLAASNNFAYSNIVPLPRNAKSVTICLPRRTSASSTFGMAFYSDEYGYNGTDNRTGGKQTTYTSNISILNTDTYKVTVPDGTTHIATSWFSTSAIESSSVDEPDFSCIVTVKVERSIYTPRTESDTIAENVAELNGKLALSPVDIAYSTLLQSKIYVIDPEEPGGVKLTDTSTYNSMYEFIISDPTSTYYAKIRTSFPVGAVFLDASRNVVGHIDDYYQQPAVMKNIIFDVPGTTKYIRLLGNTSVSDGTPTLTAKSELLTKIEGGDGAVKILGVGNSWMRDSLCELWPILHAAGMNVLIGHGYQGGDSLTTQYKGIDDETLYYHHNNFYQYVHGTHQYWEYTGISPKFTPSAETYVNGKCGVPETVDGHDVYGKDGNGGWAAKTLEYCVQKHDWDYVLLQINETELMGYEDVKAGVEDAVDVLAIITRLKQMMTETEQAKVKFGLLIKWSYPKESASAYTPTTTFLRMMNVTTEEYASMSTDERALMFRNATKVLQDRCDELAAHIGNNCFFIVNACQAIQDARDNATLNTIGVGLNRSATNTHLTVGIPKYIVGCEIAKDMLGVNGRSIISYLPDGTDPTGDTDGGGEGTPVIPTQALCYMARRIVFG